MRTYSVYYLGEPTSGEFSLCSGAFCTGPLPWNSTSEVLADALEALGITVASHSGGPLPSEIQLQIDAAELVADVSNSLSEGGEAYFGGGPISVVVTSED